MVSDPNANASAQLAIDTGTAAPSDATEFDANSFQYEFLRESMTADEDFVGGTGVRGTRARREERVKGGLITVGGVIAMENNPVDLDTLLPLVLGGTETTDSFPFAETLPEFSVLFDKGAARHIFTNCQVNALTISGSPNSIVLFEWEIFALNEVVDKTNPFTGTIPAISTVSPFVFSEMSTFSMSADASASECLGFRLRIDNRLQRRFVQSRTATKLYAGDREVTFEVQTPYGADEVDLYSQGVAGAAAQFVLTNGNRSLDITMTNLKVPRQTPVIGSRNGETTLGMRGMSYANASNNELQITNDSSG